MLTRVVGRLSMSDYKTNSDRKGSCAEVECDLCGHPTQEKDLTPVAEEYVCPVCAALLN